MIKKHFHYILQFCFFASLCFNKNIRRVSFVRTSFCFFWNVLAAESLKSPFNKVAGLKFRNFIEKKASPQLFSCEQLFYVEHLRCLILKMVEEFQRNYNLALGEGNFVVRAVGRIIWGWLVVRIIIILSFRVATSKNRNIDRGVKETCTSMSTQVTHVTCVDILAQETDHISLRLIQQCQMH